MTRRATLSCHCEEAQPRPLRRLARRQSGVPETSPKSSAPKRETRTTDKSPPEAAMILHQGGNFYPCVYPGKCGAPLHLKQRVPARALFCRPYLWAVQNRRGFWRTISQNHTDGCRLRAGVQLRRERAAPVLSPWGRLWFRPDCGRSCHPPGGRKPVRPARFCRCRQR